MGDKFLVMPNHIGQTYYDCIILDGIEPVIFTCVDESKNLYYSICVYNVVGEQEWFISRITPEAMCDLLNNKLTLREATTFGEKIWFAKESQNGSIEWTYKDAKEYPNDFLPAAGVYMDADKGEFDDEISHFKKMFSHSRSIIRAKVNDVAGLQMAATPTWHIKSGVERLVGSLNNTVISGNKSLAMHVIATAKSLDIHEAMLFCTAKGERRKRRIKKRG